MSGSRHDTVLVSATMFSNTDTLDNNRSRSQSLAQVHHHWTPHSIHRCIPVHMQLDVHSSRLLNCIPYRSACIIVAPPLPPIAQPPIMMWNVQRWAETHSKR